MYKSGGNSEVALSQNLNFEMRDWNWSFTTFQHYIGYSSLICTHLLCRGKKETEIESRETYNSTIATLVLLRARSTVPIHGTDVLRPYPMDDEECDLIYKTKR